MIEWWALIFIAIGISILIINGFYCSRRFKKGEYGWYRSGLDGVNAKAHCFLFTGERVPRISFKKYYSICRRKYMFYSGNWERIEDPSSDIMCSKCMDYIRRKSLWPGWLQKLIAYFMRREKDQSREGDEENSSLLGAFWTDVHDNLLSLCFPLHLLPCAV